MSSLYRGHYKHNIKNYNLAHPPPSPFSQTQINNSLINRSRLHLPLWSIAKTVHLLSLTFVLIMSKGLPWWLRQLSICLQCGRPRFNPWVGKVSWRREWQPTPVFLPGKSPGPRGLVSYSPWSRKELDTTEQLHFQGFSCLNAASLGAIFSSLIPSFKNICWELLISKYYLESQRKDSRLDQKEKRKKKKKLYSHVLYFSGLFLSVIFLHFQNTKLWHLYISNHFAVYQK